MSFLENEVLGVSAFFMIFSKPIPGGNNSAVDSHIFTNAFSWSLPFIHVLFFFYRLRYFCFSFQRVLLCVYLYVRFSHEAVVTFFYILIAIDTAFLRILVELILQNQVHRM